MFKIGETITCIDPADDLRKGYKYEVINLVPGRVSVKSLSYNVSSLLTHMFERFVAKMEFNVTYTQLKPQTVEMLTTFDSYGRSVILKGSGFKDVFNLYVDGKSLGLVVGTKIEYIVEQVEKKIYG